MKNKLLFLIPPLFLVATNGNTLKKVFDFRNSLGGFLFLNSTIGSAKRIIVVMMLLQILVQQRLVVFAFKKVIHLWILFQIKWVGIYQINEPITKLCKSQSDIKKLGKKTNQLKKNEKRYLLSNRKHATKSTFSNKYLLLLRIFPLLME